jgi:hypothetical protein
MEIPPYVPEDIEAFKDYAEKVLDNAMWSLAPLTPEEYRLIYGIVEEISGI